MKKLNYLLLGFAVILFLVSGCKEDGGEEEIVPKYFIDAEELVPDVPFNVENAKFLLTQTGMSELAESLEYGIKLYKIHYKTLFEGDSIIASGLVSVPVTEEKDLVFPIMSYQHGTLFTKSEAPTENFNNEFMTYLSSVGMVVLIADYIGFGSSDDVFHPYMHLQYTENAVLDMIRASQEFLKTEKPCAINDQVFMFGYSQGASATLSAIKNTEKVSTDLNITAASIGSGAYDLSEMRGWITEKARYEKPSFVLYILESFKRYADVDLAYNDVFNDEFTTSITDLIDGQTSEVSVNATFGTQAVSELFSDEFKDADIYNESETYAGLREAFIGNSIGAWDLDTKLRIYYGTDDMWIPGEQSITLYSGFTNNGAGSVAQVKPQSGKDHITTFAPTLVESVEWFLSLTKN